MEDRIPSKLVESVLVYTLTTAIILGVLLVCEVFEWLNPESRGVWFIVSTGVLSLNLVVVLPFMQVFAVSDALGLARQGLGSWAGWLEGGTYLVWLMEFWIVGYLVPLVDLEELLWWDGGSLFKSLLKVWEWTNADGWLMA